MPEECGSTSLIPRAGTEMWFLKADHMLQLLIILSVRDTSAQDALANKPPVLVPGTVIYKLDPFARNRQVTPAGATGAGAGLVQKSVLRCYVCAPVANGPLYGSYLALAFADPVLAHLLRRELRPLLEPASWQVADHDVTLLPALSGCHVHTNHLQGTAPGTCYTQSLT
jgi:hypothetical protein